MPAAQIIDEEATNKRQEEADKAVKEGEEKPKVRLAGRSPAPCCRAPLPQAGVSSFVSLMPAPSFPARTLWMCWRACGCADGPVPAIFTAGLLTCALLHVLLLCCR